MLAQVRQKEQDSPANWSTTTKVMLLRSCLRGKKFVDWIRWTARKGSSTRWTCRHYGNKKDSMGRRSGASPIHPRPTAGERITGTKLNEWTIKKMSRIRKRQSVVWKKHWGALQHGTEEHIKQLSSCIRSAWLSELLKILRHLKPEYQEHQRHVTWTSTRADANQRVTFGQENAGWNQQGTTRKQKIGWTRTIRVYTQIR